MIRRILVLLATVAAGNPLCHDTNSWFCSYLCDKSFKAEYGRAVAHIESLTETLGQIGAPVEETEEECAAMLAAERVRCSQQVDVGQWQDCERRLDEAHIEHEQTLSAIEMQFATHKRWLLLASLVAVWVLN